MLENTEGAVKIGQSRETGNIGYTRHKTNKTKTIQRSRQHRVHKTKISTTSMFNLFVRRCSHVVIIILVQISGNELTIKKVMTTPSVRRALIVGVSTSLFQQLSGINTVM